MSAPPAAAVARVAARHSLFWLVAGNLVGVWLAVVLLWPAVGDLLAPLTFGRWLPLHTDWHLYGWTALPVVGVLLAWCLDPRDPRGATHARLGFAVWSAALAVGGVTWLAGSVSGKLFLDWAGLARPLLPAAMLVLWGVLARHTLARWSGLAASARAARATLLALLLPVAPLLWWAEGPEVYPAVNPDSGGATGAALLGSTLGIVTIFLLLPPLLRAPRNAGPVDGRVAWTALAASWVVFALVDHGHTSHHSLAQIVSLGLLLLWVPLLGAFWLGHDWPAAARPWVRAAIAWWALLVVSGWAGFLPGVSEALKFTHGLVGHAHLAMAGVVTSANGLMLTALSGRAAPRGVFFRWHAGCALHVAAMLVLGAVEQEHAAALFRSEAWTQALFGLRLVGGLLMLEAAGRWLVDAWRADD